jgi:hypothetical protein
MKLLEILAASASLAGLVLADAAPESQTCPRKEEETVDLFSEPGFCEPLTGLEPSSEHSPWTHKPECVKPLYGRGSIPGEDKRFCVFTNANFRRGQGISVITSFDVAERMRKSGPLSDRDRTEIDGADAEFMANKPYEIREDPVRGKGLFATRPLKPGQTILIDYPLLLVMTDAVVSLTRKQFEDPQWRAILQLPKKSRDLARSLAKHKHDDEVVSILKTNAISQSYGQGVAYLALLPLAAVRIFFLSFFFQLYRSLPP